jgi:hypothetical protein
MRSETRTRGACTDRDLAARIDPDGDPELRLLRSLLRKGGTLTRSRWSDHGPLSGAVARQVAHGHVERVGVGVIRLTTAGRAWVARACWRPGLGRAPATATVTRRSGAARVARAARVVRESGPRRVMGQKLCRAAGCPNDWTCVVHAARAA